jgi:hypothetical protein
VAATLSQRLQYGRPYWPPFLLRGPERAIVSSRTQSRASYAIVGSHEIQVQYKALDEREEQEYEA